MSQCILFLRLISIILLYELFLLLFIIISYSNRNLIICYFDLL